MDWTQLTVAAAAAVILTAVLVLALRPRATTPSERSAASDARVDELRKQLAESERRVEEARQRVIQLEALKAVAEARVEEVVRVSEAQSAFFSDASGQMQNSFKSLAADVLRDSRGELLTAADRLLKGFSDSSAADLDSRRASLEQLVGPLTDALAAYRQESQELERARIAQLGTVQEQYRELSAAAGSLRVETAKLANALRSPHVRGHWGQLTLRRSAELAGMVNHCDFFEQETVGGGDRRLRPDMLVRLPSRRLIVVDSKVPMDGYLDAMDATDDGARAEALTRHARQTRDHVIRLGSKDYQSEFDETPEFVVAFIPSDSILAAAVDTDPELVEFALTKNVVIATPATFFALLRAIAFGWRQEQVAENAQRIHALGQELADRLSIVAAHFDKLGGALRRAVENYNDTVSSLESRVLPSARRFRALGVASRDIVEVEPIQVVPRSILSTPTGAGAHELFPDEASFGDPSIAADEAGDPPDQPPHAAAAPGSFACTCRACGREFEGSGSHAQFCSDTCRAGAPVDATPIRETLADDDR